MPSKHQGVRSRSGIPNPELFLQMSKFARDRADEFNPRQIGMVCWAYATLGTQTQEDFDMVVTEGPCPTRDLTEFLYF